MPAFEQAVAEAFDAAPWCRGQQRDLGTASSPALPSGSAPGDLLWTSPNTFVASANCARYCGARCRLCRYRSGHLQPLPAGVAAKSCEQAARDGRLPEGGGAGSFCGQPCDMAAIAELARQYGFRIIEDASHAIGGRYRDEPVGNGRYSDITVFSFHPVKIMTSAEGGMAHHQ